MNLLSTAYRVAVCATALLLCHQIPNARAQPVEQEQIEAAMTIRFLSFTEWTSSDGRQDKRTITIGIFEDRNLFEVIEALLENDQFKDRFAARLLMADDPIDAYEGLDALFFGDARERDIARTIRRLEDRPIVLMAAFDGFLEMGGMVNFIKKQKRVSFEIEVARSRAKGIEYRAKLLRLASRLVGE